MCGRENLDTTILISREGSTNLIAGSGLCDILCFRLLMSTWSMPPCFIKSHGSSCCHGWFIVPCRQQHNQSRFISLSSAGASAATVDTPAATSPFAAGATVLWQYCVLLLLILFFFCPDERGWVVDGDNCDGG